MSITVLSGHTSADTAYLVADYPYGFRLRCQIRYWIETTKYGQRVVSQTSNPKRPGLVWNTPKASTYSAIRVLFLNNENGHVENDGIGPYYADAGQVATFEATYGAALTSERDQKELRLLKAIANRSAQLSAKRAIEITTEQTREALATRIRRAAEDGGHRLALVDDPDGHGRLMYAIDGGAPLTPGEAALALGITPAAD